jgi:TonB family protein
MKRLLNEGEQDRLLIDTPQSDTRRLLKTGGVSLLIHLFLIFILFLYLGAGGSKGGGDGRGGSSVYQVTIRSLAAQNSSNSPSRQGVVTKTHISTEKDRSRAKQKQSTPIPMASTQEASSGEEAEIEFEDSSLGASVEGQGTGEEGSGSGGTGGGTGTGRSLFGLRGFGRSDVSPPRYIENPKPAYPLEARQQGYHGKVLLRVEVLTNGRVGKVEVEKSSGYEVLDRSALEAMKTWRFIPAKRGKVPIRSWVNIVITFQLRDKGF